ncbi:MAG TPA: DUF4870 domain-containing protein [Thermoanaerobaculia bacterium]|nr:DUF4870 domain-containing protein [Thermoanaerobaculia bacterium]
MPEDLGVPVPPPPPPPPPVPVSSNRSVMLVLSYLGILALIPLITEKEDREVQWNAKNGLVFLVAYLVLTVALFMASFVIGVVGMLQIPLPLGYLVLIILGITNALNGKRFVIPGLSDFADKF